MNRTKTLMLLAGLTALFVWGGHALAGQGGMVIALLLAVVMNVGAYWFSDKIVLRMHRAQPVTEAEAPELYFMVRDLAVRAGLPMPKVYILPAEAPNAFATGRNPENAAVAVTMGLLNLLNQNELRGVLAHELSHIKNRDTLVMTVAATLAGALSVLADMAMWGAILGGGRNSEHREGSHPLAGLIGIIVAPLAAMLIQMAISRTREYMADQTGARMTMDPLALASALTKIEKWSRRVPLESGGPATAHLFIINPFTAGGMAQLFSTHPATRERVKRLEEMVAKADYMMAS